MHTSSYNLMRDAVAAHVRRGSTVADVGARNVNGTYRPLFQHCQYTGLDVTSGKNVERVVGAYDFGSTRYDVVVSGQCLEHVFDTHRWAAALLSIVLPGGVFIVIAPHTWPEHRFPVDCWRILPDGMRWLFTEGAQRYLNKDPQVAVLECRASETDTLIVGQRRA